MLFTEAPVINASEKKFNITEGDSITCTATGYPAPDIVWLNMNNNESEVDKDRLETYNSMGVGNLSIISVAMTVGRNDTGVYKCIANNSISYDTRTINITVHCKKLCIATANGYFNKTFVCIYSNSSHRDNRTSSN